MKRVTTLQRRLSFGRRFFRTVPSLKTLSSICPSMQTNRDELFGTPNWKYVCNTFYGNDIDMNLYIIPDYNSGQGIVFPKIKVVEMNGIDKNGLPEPIEIEKEGLVGLFGFRGYHYNGTNIRSSNIVCMDPKTGILYNGEFKGFDVKKMDEMELKKNRLELIKMVRKAAENWCLHSVCNTSNVVMNENPWGVKSMSTEYRPLLDILNEESGESFGIAFGHFDTDLLESSEKEAWLKNELLLINPRYFYEFPKEDITPSMSHYSIKLRNVFGFGDKNVNIKKWKYCYNSGPIAMLRNPSILLEEIVRKLLIFIADNASIPRCDYGFEDRTIENRILNT